MTDEAATPGLPVLVDDPDAPVVFTDELTGGGPLQGNLNLTFAVVQYDHSVDPPKAYRKVCLRVVMPKSAAQAAWAFLNLRYGTQPNAAQGSPGPKLN